MRRWAGFTANFFLGILLLAILVNYNTYSWPFYSDIHHSEDSQVYSSFQHLVNNTPLTQI